MTVAVGKASRVSKARRVDKTGLATHTDVMHFPVTSRLAKKGGVLKYCVGLCKGDSLAHGQHPWRTIAGMTHCQ
jgi:hypothetical protein